MQLSTHTDSEVIELAIAAHTDMILSFDTYLDDMTNAQKELDYLNTEKMFDRFKGILRERNLVVEFPDL